MNILYLFITMPISNMGGVQAYVAAKSNYLRSIGYKVHLVFSGYKSNISSFTELNQYSSNRISEIGYPPYFFKQKLITNVINNVKKIIGDDKYDSIVLESHDDTSSQWGEIIANELKAKHIFILMNEHYRNSNQHYTDKIDFYKFKLLRREIMGRLEVAQRLFECYLTVPEKYANPFLIDEEPVQDVEDDRVKSIKKYDYNICYIGRTNKVYVPNIIKGVADFSRKHPENQIQFILIGDASIVREEINTFCKDIKNLYVNEIGEIVPLPRSLFFTQEDKDTQNSQGTKDFQGTQDTKNAQISQDDAQYTDVIHDTEANGAVQKQEQVANNIKSVAHAKVPNKAASDAKVVKVDVFIAGSGSARCVAYEGAKVIVAGTEERLALGVLGIDTQESVYWDGKSEKLPFDLALEKVLIEKAYDGMKVNYPKQGVEYCTKQNFEAIARSEQRQEYYDIEELTSGPKVNYLKFRLKALVLYYFPNLAVFIKKRLIALSSRTHCTSHASFSSKKNQV